MAREIRGSKPLEHSRVERSSPFVVCNRTAVYFAMSTWVTDNLLISSSFRFSVRFYRSAAPGNRIKNPNAIQRKLNANIVDPKRRGAISISMKGTNGIMSIHKRNLAKCKRVMEDGHENHWLRPNKTIAQSV